VFNINITTSVLFATEETEVVRFSQSEGLFAYNPFNFE